MIEHSADVSPAWEMPYLVTNRRATGGQNTRVFPQNLQRKRGATRVPSLRYDQKRVEHMSALFLSSCRPQGKNMCGIVGYTGTEEASPKIMKGLSILEYRGYDSAGLAVVGERQIATVKCCGRIKNLEEKSRQAVNLPQGCCAIGHTRWATHGEIGRAHV